ncbi:TIGR02452 family protein [Undibacterium sp. Ji50W]|uniref:TIGR02452 family protein n=1 Tax=Undibacterium sp. Ji50W TaxID=3413041 RepID=UPI003BF3F93B
MKTTSVNRKQRADIARDSLDIFARGSYTNLHGHQVNIEKDLSVAILASKHYTADALKEILGTMTNEPRFATQVVVKNETSLSATNRLIEEGADNPLCLNFASAKNPGGGFLGGSEAQEESLAKSSGLYPCIAQMTAMYEKNRNMHSSIYHDDMIYSPRVPVFRGDDYALLDSTYLASFITAPAVNLGALKKNEPHRLQEVAEIMQLRVNLVLALAQQHGHKQLVLGAWGCGVFANDPKDIAIYFANATSPDAPFHGAFEKIIFAVLDKSNSGTYSAFEAIFKNF